MLGDSEFEMQAVWPHCFPRHFSSLRRFLAEREYVRQKTSPSRLYFIKYVINSRRPLITTKLTTRKACDDGGVIDIFSTSALTKSIIKRNPSVSVWSCHRLLIEAVEENLPRRELVFIKANAYIIFISLARQWRLKCSWRSAMKRKRHARRRRHSLHKVAARIVGAHNMSSLSGETLSMRLTRLVALISSQKRRR